MIILWLLLCMGLSGQAHVDPSSILVPSRTWLEDLHEGEDIAYAVAAVPGGGAVVVGTSGVVKYSLQGDAIWVADYPGTAYGVAVDPQGETIVAGTEGLARLSPDGELIWRLEGSFLDIDVCPDGILVVVEQSSVWLLSADGRTTGTLPYPGDASCVAVEGGMTIIGGCAGAAAFHLGTMSLSWIAPYPGDIRDVALDGNGNVFLVGSAGLHAYCGSGEYLWEQAFPGEAQAGSTYMIPGGDPWVLAAGTTYHEGRARIVVVAFNAEGERVWQSLKGGPDEDSLGYGLASDLTESCFYVVGATSSFGLGDADADYRTIQYALTTPGDESGGEDCDPHASFEPDEAAPLVGETVGFLNSSHAMDGHLVTWVWDFGDGAVSRAWSPTHAYNRPGTYTVTLTVFDDQMCSATASADVQVEARPPEVLAVQSEAGPNAGFTWTVVPGVYGSYPAGFVPDGPTSLDDVLFVDRSGWGLVTLRAEADSPDGAIMSYQWDLTHDGEFDAQGDTVSWSFEEPGVYAVTLVVTCEHGQSSAYETFVDTADFEPLAWIWDFDDGAACFDQHPEHRYEQRGEYAVTLTVFDDSGGSDALTQWITVVNVPPVSGFAWEAQEGEGELEAGFTWTVDQERHGAYPDGFDPGENPAALDELLLEDLSTAAALANVVQFASEAFDVDGEIVSWSWDFGDGATSEERDPIHEYAEAGTYTVRLTVTDDAGDTDTHENTVEVAPGTGAITAWAWEFGDGNESELQHPEHSYEQPGEYAVTLTVFDGSGSSGSLTQWITVVNVPPVAMFRWGFDQPETLFPPCEAVFGDHSGGMDGGFFCAQPEIPDNTGILRLDGTDSHDGEPWLELAEWEWGFVFGDGWADAYCVEDCDELDPSYLLSVGERALYRGDVDVTLLVWDQEWEGGEDYPFSHATETVTVDNIPPYVAFEWSSWWSWATLNCESCAADYGEGDAHVEINVGTVTVSREIAGSWDCWDYEAILGPWEEASVYLNITGSGIVWLTETMPEGWSYELVSWRLPDCVTVLEEEDGYFMLAVNLAQCDWDPQITYQLQPPQGSVAPGRHMLQGFVEEPFEGGEGEALDSEVVLCTTVNVEVPLDLYGDAWDPNEDEIVSWAWVLDLGDDVWTSSGSWVNEDFHLEGLVCEWDEDEWAWVWSFDLPTSLTVTDSGGASTTVDGLVPLRGTMMGAVPF